MQVEEAEEEGADTPKHTGKPAKEPAEEPAAAPGPPPATAPAPAAEQPAQAEAPSQPAPEDAPAAASGGAAGAAARESKEDPASAKQPEAAAAEAEPATAKEAGAAAPAQPVVQDQAVMGLLQVRPAGIVFSALQAGVWLRTAWLCLLHGYRCFSCLLACCALSVRDRALQHAQARVHMQVLAAELLNARATPQLRSVADMCLQARPAYQGLSAQRNLADTADVCRDPAQQQQRGGEPRHACDAACGQGDGPACSKAAGADAGKGSALAGAAPPDAAAPCGDADGQRSRHHLLHPAAPATAAPHAGAWCRALLPADNLLLCTFKCVASRAWWCAYDTT